jgi:hypothetical protein
MIGAASFHADADAHETSITVVDARANRNRAANHWRRFAQKTGFGEWR